MELAADIFKPRLNQAGEQTAWDTALVHEHMLAQNPEQSLRTTERAIEASGLLPSALNLDALQDEYGRETKTVVVEQLDAQAKQKRWTSLIIQQHTHASDIEAAGTVLMANDARGGRRWLYNIDIANPDALLQALNILAADKSLIVWPTGAITAAFRTLVTSRPENTHTLDLASGKKLMIGTVAYQEIPPIDVDIKPVRRAVKNDGELSHLDRLEAESMYIIREVMAQAENPVMLYSIGKDSSVMLHLAKKAFYPSPPPFPLMHVDTRWKFQAMYNFRDAMTEQSGMQQIVHINPEGVDKDVNPFSHGSSLHTDIMKTQGLKQALDKYKFDVAFGGARRDEEKSRAKERVFSFRTPTHRWDPKNQRPELWNLYNGYKKPGESIRVFPISNWTELDIWQYIYREQIPIVPLYYAAERPVVERDGMLMLVDDNRLELFEGEQIQIKRVRFRTLGCYPLTGAVESAADDLPSIVLELLQSKTSERQGRAIDSDSSGSMEKKKQEGYF